MRALYQPHHLGRRRQREAAGELVDAGLDHAQLSFQGADQATNDRLGHYEGAWEKKRAFAAMVTAAGLPLTMNAVINRTNLHQVGAVHRACASSSAPRRLEIAHTQYYGWALANRAALIPPRKETEAAIALVEAARPQLAGRLVIDMVVPDYYARYPKPCAGGWGRLAINVSPVRQGAALPRGGDRFPASNSGTSESMSLADIWRSSPAFSAFRGTDWMRRALPVLRPARDRLGRLPLPGARADRRRRGDRSRLPKSPHHARIEATATAEAEAGASAIRWRSFKETRRGVTGGF